MIKCKSCKDVLVSKHRHDFVHCSCGKVAIDGGDDYTRVIGRPTDYEDVVSIDKASPSEWDRLRLTQEELKALDEVSELDQELGFYQDNDEALWPKGKEKVEVMFANALRDAEQVIDLGGRKHGYGSWKDPANPSLQRKANHASMSRHAAEYFMEIDKDPESGVDPLLHLMVRAAMAYERKVRGIKDADK